MHVTGSECPAHPTLCNTSSDGTIFVWDAKTLREYKQVADTQHKQAASHESVACICPIGPHVWMSTRSSLHILDSFNAKILEQVEYEEQVTCMVQVGNEIWTCDAANTILIWNHQGEVLHKVGWAGHSEPVTCIAYYRALHHVWTASADSVTIWDTKTYAKVTNVGGGENVTALLRVKNSLWAATTDIITIYPYLGHNTDEH